MTDDRCISWISVVMIGGLLLAGSFLSGCGSSQATVDQKPASDSESSTEIVVNQNDPDDEGLPNSVASSQTTEAAETADPGREKVLRPEKVAAHIDEAARDWYGVPYEWAGESKDGVDCSAFVQNVYQEAFSYQLPRVTETQVQAGSKVTRSQVRAGDLVFFQPEGEWNHVGVYLGDNTFVHASSSDGVTEDSFDASYWRRYYWTARRLLTPSVLPDSLTSELVAYRSPDAASDTSTAPTRPDAGDEQMGDSQSERTQDETITIASCEDADVECGPSGEKSSSDGQAMAASDTTTRKGW